MSIRLYQEPECEIDESNNQSPDFSFHYDWESDLN